MREFLVCVCALFALTVYSQTSANCWPVFRGDNQFQGRTASKLPESFSLKWIYKSNEKVKSSPIICGNKIYIATTAGSVICLDNKGKEIWKIKEEVSFEAPPIFLNNTLYIGSLEGTFYALNADKSSKKWVFNTNSQIIGSANWYRLGTKTNIIFGCYDNKIYCLDPANGKLNWTYETENFINGAPAISEKLIVFGGCDSYLHVINKEKGALVKKIVLGTYIASSAAIVQNNAFLGNYDGDFMSVDLEKGTLNWKISLNNQASVISSPSVVKNKVIIGAQDQRVHCLDAKTGQKLWSFKTQGNVDASPVVDNNKVLACSIDGRIYILNINTGTEIFSFDLGSPISGTPAIIDGLIVVAADNGNIYGFNY
jgi:outer membrane protein assembly factor BamB